MITDEMLSNWLIRRLLFQENQFPW